MIKVRRAHEGHRGNHTQTQPLHPDLSNIMDIVVSISLWEEIGSCFAQLLLECTGWQRKADGWSQQPTHLHQQSSRHGSIDKVSKLSSFWGLCKTANVSLEIRGKGYPLVQDKGGARWVCLITLISMDTSVAAPTMERWVEPGPLGTNSHERYGKFWWTS